MERRAGRRWGISNQGVTVSTCGTCMCPGFALYVHEEKKSGMVKCTIGDFATHRIYSDNFKTLFTTGNFFVFSDDNYRNDHFAHLVYRVDLHGNPHGVEKGLIMRIKNASCQPTLITH